MKKKLILTTIRVCSLLCLVSLLAFNLFSSCQQPESEPEPPTPQPVNRFVGTWVLCAKTNVDSEPPASCDLANATTDTLVFANDSMLIHHHGAESYKYFYEFSDHFFICYWPDAASIKCNNQYYFRDEYHELVLRGNFARMGLKNFCFRRVSQQ